MREWNEYVRRIRKLANPIENAHDWMQTCLGLAVGTIYATAAFGHAARKHTLAFLAVSSPAIAFTVLSVFFFFLARKQDAGMPESIEGIAAAMEEHRDARVSKKGETE